MILVGMGSNLPFCGIEPPSVLQFALDAIARDLEVAAASRPFHAPAWPNPGDPPFANAVAEIRTPLDAEDVLAALLDVEDAFGRRRAALNAPRTLDLDLLAYDDLIMPAIEGGDLILPHPGLAERDFVLAPLCDLAPDWRHPVLGRRADDLLRSLEPVGVRPIEGFRLTLGRRVDRASPIWKA